MQAAIPLMVVGSLVQGVAGYQAGKFNKHIAEVNAVNALGEGTAEGQRIREQSRAAMGEQLASLAGNGFDPGTGSALTRLSESAIAAEMDIQEARRRARSRAMAYKSQGALAMAEGRNKLIGGLFGAASAVTKVNDFAQLGAEYGGGS